MDICHKGGEACGGLHRQRFIKLNGNNGGTGCAVTQVVSHWFLNVVDQIQSWDNQCQICGKQILVFLCQLSF
jgi:hypothetical protein